MRNDTIRKGETIIGHPADFFRAACQFRAGPFDYTPEPVCPGCIATVFYKDEAGAIFHTYSAYARGLDMLVGAYNYLDIVPKGRDEAELPWTMAWVRHHDRYGDRACPGSLPE